MIRKEAKFISKYTPGSFTNSAAEQPKFENERANTALLIKERNKNNYALTQKIVENLQTVLAQDHPPQIEFIIHERNPDPKQPELKITLNNLEFDKYNVIYTRSDSPDQKKSLDYYSFCLTTGLVTRDSNQFFVENTALTSRFIPATNQNPISF